MTQQIFIEYSDDDYVTSTQVQVTSSDIDQVFPNVWETFDASINLIWLISGSFTEPLTNQVLENPLAYLRIPEENFDENRKIILQDVNGDFIQNVNFPIIRKDVLSDSVYLCYLDDNGNLFFSIGSLFPKSNNPTYTFSEPGIISTGVDQSRPSLVITDDGRIYVFFLSNEILKFVISQDSISFSDGSFQDTNLLPVLPNLPFFGVGQSSFPESLFFSPFISDTNNLSQQQFFITDVVNKLSILDNPFIVSDRVLPDEVLDNQFPGVYDDIIESKLYVSVLSGVNLNILDIYMSPDRIEYVRTKVSS